jgi:long-subunit acyl-CoA synthetase (AMP-forming)
VVSVLMPLVAGGSVFLTDRFDPKTFFDVVERERPTYFSAVPTIYNMGGDGSVVTINVRPQFAETGVSARRAWPIMSTSRLS